MRTILTAAAAALVAAIAVFLLTSREPRGRLDSPAVLAQVQRLSRLVTVKYTVQKVVGLEEKKKPLGSESILLIVQARVEAGVDLESLRPGDVTVRGGGTVVLRLPEAAILSVAINEHATKVWDRQKTWWTPWVPYSLDLEQRARVAGLEAAREAALEMGILTQARQNAESSIRSLLGLAGVREVVILPEGAS